MKVSHAKDGGQAVELEHAALVLVTRELIHTYPEATVRWVIGKWPDASPDTVTAVGLAKWAASAVQVLRSIAEADQADEVRKLATL